MYYMYYLKARKEIYNFISFIQQKHIRKMLLCHIGNYTTLLLYWIINLISWKNKTICKLVFNTGYGGCNLDIPIYVAIINFSELGPGSNERYENSTFYGSFRFLIIILIFNKKIILYISHFIEKISEMACLYLLHWFMKLFFY